MQLYKKHLCTDGQFKSTYVRPLPKNPPIKNRHGCMALKCITHTCFQSRSDEELRLRRQFGRQHVAALLFSSPSHPDSVHIPLSDRPKRCPTMGIYGHRISLSPTCSTAHFKACPNCQVHGESLPSLVQVRCVNRRIGPKNIASDYMLRSIINHLLYWRIQCFHRTRTSVFFRYTANMLVYNNIQWSIGKSTFAVAMGQRRQLTVQVLHITTQITTSSVYANLVQVALCFAPQRRRKFFFPMGRMHYY